jgi:hypothetical protein
MKLSTLECSVLGCGREFHADLPMFHVEHMARDVGWRVDDEATLCPEHNTPDGLAELESWVVGCYSCGYEENMSEDDARYEYKEHECEADTYLRTPAELRETRRRTEEYREKRATERAHEEELARHSAERALQRQHQIETYARNWLRIRNTFVFWNRRSIHEGSDEGDQRPEDRQPAREGGSGDRER